MIRLILKDIRLLSWYIVLWMLLSLIGVALQFFDTRLDEQTFAEWCDPLCQGGIPYEYALFMIVFFLVGAYSGMSREFSDGTIDFLNALPVSRIRIFLSKFLAAWGLISLLTIFQMLIEYGLLSLNSQSLAGRNYPKVLFNLVLMDMALAYQVVAYGLFFSWFRTQGIFLFAVFLGLTSLVSALYPPLHFLSPFSTYRVVLEGAGIGPDWPVIAGHLAWCTVLLFAAYRLWRLRPSSEDWQPVSSSSRRWPGILLITVVFLIAIFGVFANLLEEGGLIMDETTSQYTSDHYTLIHKTVDESRVSKLASSVDDDYLELARRLNTDKRPSIIADLSASSEHATGLATWKKIKVDLKHGFSSREYRRIISHETVHVFQSVIANNSNFGMSAGGFFMEGMAQHLSFAVVSDPEARASNWMIAAVAADRFRLGFNDLANTRLIQQEYHEELVYTLGDTWVIALVEFCGEATLGDVLRLYRDNTGIRQLRGVSFWRQALGQLGCSLDAVNQHWDQLLSDVRAVGDVASFPRFGDISFTRAPSTVVVSVDVTGKVGALHGMQYYLRMLNDLEKNSLSADPLMVSGRFVEGSSTSETSGRVEFLIPVSVLDGITYRYQLGYRPDTNSRLYMEKWERIILPD